MKYILRAISFLFIFCAVSLELSAQKDFLGIPSIDMGGKSYNLCWSAKTKNGRFLEEFLSKDESYARFETKLIIECTPEGKSLEGEVNEMMGKLALKKEQSIVYSFEQIETQRPGELWIEYVQGNVQGGQPFTLEWNLNRYVLIDNRVVLFRICHRGYNMELNDFTKKANKMRNEWIKQSLDFSFDKITIVQ